MEHLPVTYRPEALRDIDSIFLYVLDISQSLATAQSFTDRIFEHCERIGDVPRGGISRGDLGEGVRLVPFERSAVILYRLNGDTVEVLNIFYRGRDYEAILSNKQ
ncbi:type II toxin-antitoxin system RelE/ParE family toxin [Neorhizobium sp. T25_13]|uniref:type II toxin-antitoxin system RelE/ParE family toxin n=1 Tax=Neorhizobium sp. T25_13 TaxID=2093830 RepID=UPI000CF8C89C|nr:type II toxin-antitoxin system RelE/ParE family toxin [Neorhizobium sp. T25_13]